MGIYFSRHAFLHTLEIEKIIEPASVPRLVKGFIELAAPDPKERVPYLRGFEYPACRKWARGLESIPGAERQEASKGRLQ